MEIAVLRHTILASLALASLAVSASAATDVAWGKAGVPAETMLSDLDRCQTKAAAVKADPSAGGRNLMPSTYTGPGAVGAAIGAAIVQHREDARARAAYIPRCMHKAGYHALSLSDREQAESRKLASRPALVAWLDAYYQRPNYPLRLAAATLPALPEAAIEPLTYGAVRFDPANLKAARRRGPERRHRSAGASSA